MLKAAIHQPDFFPWLGNFNKMWMADVFIIMDSSQYKKTGSNWSNRTKVIISGNPNWINIPLERSYHGLRNYQEMKIKNLSDWRGKIIKTLQTNYGKADYFGEVFPCIYDLVSFNTTSLLAYNMNTLLTLIDKLGIDSSKFIMSSTLNSDGKATDYLISLIKSAGAESYICGGGASGYQDDDKFAQYGIKLIYQNFKHPVYRQFNNTGFVPGLSIIDALMNLGFTTVAQIIRNH